ncbi:hypothetical protein E4L96_10435 [Massilia arenosa]|uniref:DUF4189 domain-containing protein n=1 Tax=Zemynaea arenosa TaxID=2561931 RepID=A0A4Y9SCM7_9BURK|nr:hypothetical protein [Massilia arenosa]TFW20381.1 hypothetical protein E4L96_10435 [Massilia arenosa]
MRFAKPVRVFIGLLAVAAAVAPAYAGQNACLLEGSLKFAGQTIESKDCMQNGGAKPADFLEACNQIAKMGAALGAPPKVTYMDACPAQAQGVCVGVFSRQISAYYYKRDPKDLPDVKSSCELQGGKWKAK